MPDSVMVRTAHSIPCIEHHYTRHNGGYAVVSHRKDEGGGGGQNVSLHRAVYSRAFGIPLIELRGKVVMHICDNPACINPLHLRVGTKGRNNTDRAEKGRSAKVVPSRQRLTKKDVRDIQDWPYKHYCKVNGVSAIARHYGVDVNVIRKVREGTYVASR